MEVTVIREQMINFHRLKNPIPTPIVNKLAAAGCDCSLYTCGCCVDNIPLLNDVCVNITWDAETLTIEVLLDVNGIVVFDKKFEDPQNPLEICENAGCQVCLSLDNLNVTYRGVCGNVDLNITCFGFQKDWDLGAFKLGTDCTSLVPQSVILDDLKKKS